MAVTSWASLAVIKTHLRQLGHTKASDCLDIVYRGLPGKRGPHDVEGIIELLCWQVTQTQLKLA